MKLGHSITLLTLALAVSAPALADHRYSDHSLERGAPLHGAQEDPIGAVLGTVTSALGADTRYAPETNEYHRERHQDYLEHQRERREAEREWRKERAEYYRERALKRAEVERERAHKRQERVRDLNKRLRKAAKKRHHEWH